MGSRLTLAKPIKSTQTISLDYSDPDNSANDVNVIQSIYGADADSLSNIEVTNDSILDGTPPSLEKILFPWPDVHGVVGVSAPGFDINVTDTESTIKELQITFASPDGTDEVTVDVDTSKTAHGSKNLPGSVAEYRNSWTIPESNQPGSIQGGFWKVKSVKVVDDSDNEGIYTRVDFPAAIAVSVGIVVVVVVWCGCWCCWWHCWCGVVDAVVVVGVVGWSCLSDRSVMP